MMMVLTKLKEDIKMVDYIVQATEATRPWRSKGSVTLLSLSLNTEIGGVSLLGQRCGLIHSIDT